MKKFIYMALGVGVAVIGFFIYQKLNAYPEATVGLAFEYDYSLEGYVCVGQDDDYAKTWISDLVIPEKYNDKPVVAVGDNAFSSIANRLYTITIPSSVKKIGKSAFSTYSTQIIYFERYSEQLRQIKFFKGSKLEIIDDYAFFDCVGIEELNIPASVLKIGECAFAYDGGAVGYAPGSKLKKIVFELDGKLESIGNLAFGYHSQLTEVNLPGEIKELGNNIFIKCDKLETISFRNSVERWTELAEATGNNTIDVRCVNGTVKKEK